MMPTRQRPAFFQLFQLHLPVTALVSIAHRLSGLLLFLALAPLLWLLERSLASADGFAFARQVLQGWPMHVFGALLAWALVHHLFAGLRVLLIDADIGVAYPLARRSAWWVAAAGGLALIVGVVWP